MIIPEVKEYAPLRTYLSTFHFVGPIVYRKIEARDRFLEIRLKKLSHGKKTIYLTFGGTGFGKKLLVRLAKGFVTKGYFVMVATGNIADPEELDLPRGHAYTSRFIPGFSACNIADIVVCHGSYGTITQALYWGKPTVSLPFNLDQVIHALRTEELHAGISLIKYRLHHFLIDWVTQQREAENFPADTIIRETERVLRDKSYKKGAQKFSRHLQDLGGAKKAAQIISDLLDK